MSVEETFLDDVRDAKVFDRGRKGEEDTGDTGAVEEKLLSVGCEGDRLDESEPTDCDRDVIGTIKFCTLGLATSTSPRLGNRPSATSSLLGIGRPRAAAISWCSAQSSLKSSRPLQKGAIRLSTYTGSENCPHYTSYAYHQLSYNSFVEVFYTRIHSHRDQIPTVNMLFPQTSLSFLDTCCLLLFYSSSFTFLLCLATLGNRVVGIGA